MMLSHTFERGIRAAAWRASRRQSGDLAALLVQAVGALAAAAAAACGGVLAFRRLAGAAEPAAAALLLGVAAAGVALVLAADAARRAGGSVAGPIVARVGLAAAVVSLAFPPRTAGPWGWLAVAAAVGATAGAGLRMPRAAVPVRWPKQGDSGPGRPPRRTAARAARRRRIERPGYLRQRFERRELPTGDEHLRGRLVVAVPAGARTGYGHLGFCPAFATTPTVEVTTAYDGVEATVTAAEVLPWGVRVECRLAEPADEPLEIPVDMAALAPSATP